MSSKRNDLDRDLRTVVAALGGNVGEHPDPEELIAYDARAVTDEEGTRIQDHLALCPHCAQAVLDLANLPNLPEDTEAPVSPRGIDGRWREFQALVGKPDRSTRRFRLLPLAAAALLIFALVGLSLSVRRLSSPHTDLQLIDLSGEDVPRASTSELDVRLRAGATRLVWVFAAPEFGRDITYGVRLVALGEGKGEVWHATMLPPSRDGVLVIDLPSRLLPPGRYRIELTSGPGSGLLAEYRVRLVR